MKPLFALLILLCGYSAFSQDNDFKFGEVSKEDLLMTAYDKDTSAAAVILFARGETVVDKQIGSSMKTYMRIKFFDKRAFDEWGSCSITGAKFTIVNVKGATYHWDKAANKIIKTELDNANIFKTRHTKDVDKVTFTLPALTEGCIIEYSYTHRPRGHLEIPNWSFQHDIPVKHSEYLLTNSIPIKIDLRGTLPAQNERKYEGRFNRWYMDDVPAFKEEPYMPDETMYRSKMNFWDPDDTWGGIADVCYGSEAFGQVVRGNIFLAKSVQSVVGATKDPLEKIRLLSDFVKNSVTWNGTSDYFADPPKEVLEKKTGTSGDINILFGSVLDKAGFKVNMVLTSTRKHGFIYDQYPAFRQFNDVFCMVIVGSDTLMLDATEKLLPYNILPTRLLNYRGLMIDEKIGAAWITIQPKELWKTTVSGDFLINPAGSLDGTLSYKYESYSGASERKEYYAKGEAEYLKDFESEKRLLLRKSEFTNMDDRSKPVNTRHEVNISEEIVVTDDKIYFNPYIALREEENPFVSQERLYPIDLILPQQKTFVCSFTLPENYQIDELPKNSAFTLPNKSAMCSFNIAQVGNKLTVTSRVWIKKPLFIEDEYPYLREIFNIMVAKKAEQVVLKKAAP
jgi:hypothetical protein